MNTDRPAHTIRAFALLDHVEPDLRKVRVLASGHRFIKATLGIQPALWAYADNGDKPGQRHRSSAAEALRAWQPTPTHWCRLLTGITGIGKTLAAARYVAEKPGRREIIKAADADHWGFGGGESLAEACRADWLLIDDYGNEKTGPGVANIATLIADRAMAGRFTVITSNRTPADIEAKSDHLASRLRPFHVVLTDTEDLRMRIVPGVEPSIGHLRHVLRVEQAAEFVDDVSRGYITGEDADAAIERLVTLLNVDRGELAKVTAERAEDARAMTELFAGFADVFAQTGVGR